MKRCSLVALTVLFVLLGTMGEATADHQFAYGHWHATAFPGVANVNSARGNVEDAAYYWEDRAGKGYAVVADGVFGDCGFHPGWITTCTVSRSRIVGGLEGQASVLWDGNGHIYAAVVLVANDLQPVRRQQVWRHEMGHAALGLGHTGDQRCVMKENADVPPGTVCQHDLDAAYGAARV